MLESAAIVNSTPLWEISHNINEPQPLSPAMLLNQREDRNNTNMDNITKDDIQAYGHRRWRRIEALSDQFWKEWQNHYLLAQHDTRRQWKDSRRNLQVGDLVLIREKGSPRCLWPTGTIKEVKISEDALVRSVVVTQHAGPDDKGRQLNRERPIHQLVLLKPMHTEGSESGPSVAPSQ